MKNKITVYYQSKPKGDFDFQPQNTRLKKEITLEKVNALIETMKKTYIITRIDIDVVHLTPEMVDKIKPLLTQRLKTIFIGKNPKTIRAKLSLNQSSIPTVEFDSIENCIAIAKFAEVNRLHLNQQETFTIPEQVLGTPLLSPDITGLLVKSVWPVSVQFNSAKRALDIAQCLIEEARSKNDTTAAITFTELGFTFKFVHQKRLYFTFQTMDQYFEFEESIKLALTSSKFQSVGLSLPEGSEAPLKALLSWYRSGVYQTELSVRCDGKTPHEMVTELQEIKDRNKALLQSQKNVNGTSIGRLNLASVPVSTEDGSAISQFYQESQFSTISIRLYGVGAIPDGFFDTFEPSQKLVSLSIENSGVGEKSVATLSKLIASSSRLTALEISNCQLDYNAVLQCLCEADSLPKLESIDISSHDSLSYDLTLLTRLLVRLPQCSIDFTPKDNHNYYNNSASDLSNTVVNLSPYEVDRDSLLDILKVLSDCQTLTTLELGKKIIDKEILHALIACVDSVPTLTTISLEQCQCTDDVSEGLNALVAKPQLTTVSLRGAKIDFSHYYKHVNGTIPEKLVYDDRLMTDINKMATALLNIQKKEDGHPDSTEVTITEVDFKALFSSPFRSFCETQLQALLSPITLKSLKLKSCIFCDDSLTFVLKLMIQHSTLQCCDFSNSTFDHPQAETLLGDFLKEKSIQRLNLLGTDINCGKLFVKLADDDQYYGITNIITPKYGKAFSDLSTLNKALSSINSIENIQYHDVDPHLTPRLVRLISTADHLQTAQLSAHYDGKEVNESVLKAICSHASIRELDLSNNKLSDTCITLLHDHLVSKNCRIRSLTLNHCKTTASALQHFFAALEKNKSLVSLSVNDIDALEECIDHIGVALSKNTTLLNISALETIPYPNFIIENYKNSSPQAKANAEHFRLRTERVRDFAYAIMTGMKQKLAPNRKIPKTSQNKTLITCKLFIKDMTSVAANKTQRTSLAVLSTLLESNQSRVRSLFAGLLPEQPNIETIKGLLREGMANVISPYVTDENGDTLLHIAVRKKLIALIKFYFSFYADWHIDTTIVNHAQESVLSLAEATHDEDIVNLINNPDKTPIPKITKSAKQSQKKKSKVDKKSDVAPADTTNADASMVSKKHIIEVSAQQPPSKKLAKDSSEPEAMNTDESPLDELCTLIKSHTETQDTLLKAKKLLKHIMIDQLDRSDCLACCITTKQIKMATLLIYHGVNINLRPSEGHFLLTIAAVHNVWPIFMLMLKHPMLEIAAVQETLDYCNTHNQPFSALYQEHCQKRLNAQCLPQRNVQWVKDMTVIFGSKNTEKVVTIPSRDIQTQLFFQNQYTKAVLSKRVEPDSEAEKAGGNPVTCSITFITSGHKPNTRQSIVIPVDLPEKAFHLSLHDHEKIDSARLRETIQSRSENGLERLYNREQFVNDHSNCISPDKITNEELLHDSWFAQLFHHGEQSLISALEDEKVLTKVMEKLFASQNFVWGSKIYGVVLDISSPNYVCSNCILGVLSVQDPTTSPMLKKLKTLLKSNGCKLPVLSSLKMITRVGSYKAFETNTPMSLDDHKSICIDIKLTGNRLILQQDMVQTAGEMTQFNSSNK